MFRRLLILAFFLGIKLLGISQIQPSSISDSLKITNLQSQVNDQIWSAHRFQDQQYNGILMQIFGAGLMATPVFFKNLTAKPLYVFGGAFFLSGTGIRIYSYSNFNKYKRKKSTI